MTHVRASATSRALEARGRRLAIATPLAAATRAALDGGGTAVDAAVTACAVLAVAYPHMCSIGGDLFALLRRPTGEVVAVNGNGAAPAAADAEALRRREGRMPLTGPATITVPGVVAAWRSLLEMEGTRGLGDALAPAVRLAAEGCRVAPSLARAIAIHRRALARDPGMASVFLPGGHPLGAGDPLRQPVLASTLEALAETEGRALYDGPVGRRFAAGLRALGCPMTPEDLSAHRTELAAPLAVGYREHEILTHPPNSQGFLLLETVRVLEELGVGLDASGPRAGLVARAFAAVSRDRERYLADPRSAPVPVEELLSDAHVRQVAARVREGRAGAPMPPARPARGDTVAVVAADGEGRAVSIIQSIFHSFGAGILEPATGIVCQNRGACFTLDPASPNVLEGGKRPAHTLMPVLVRRGEAVRFVGGTMGGLAQPQIHVHVLGHVLERGTDVGAAVAAPRWVVGSLEAGGPTEVIFAERIALERCGPALRASGLPVVEIADLNEEVGHAQYIRVGEDGALEAASDPRADGEAGAC
jgi:gamma-glutamyltranspeptidase